MVVGDDLEHSCGSRAREVFLNVAVVALIVLIVGPWSGVRRSFNDWRSERNGRRLIEEVWIELGLDRVGERLVLIEVADYQCPFCRFAAPLVWDIESRGDSVVFLHLPLTNIHPRAEQAARTSVCAEGQGRGKEMHRLLFTENAWESGVEVDWSAMAVRVGVEDLDLFNACLSSRATDLRLVRDRDLARRLGVDGTPTFVGRRGMLIGVPTVESISSIM